MVKNDPIAKRRPDMKASKVDVHLKNETRKLLEDARQTVKPIVLTERKAEEFSEAISNLRLK